MVLVLYRLAHLLCKLGIPIVPRFIYGFNRIAFSVVLPPSACLGQGVLLGYSGLGIVIHARAVIGDRVSIGTGVTIGGRGKVFGVPIIESDVEIGSGAKILGDIRVGKGAVIGANAVVIADVEPYSVVVGVPARVVRFRTDHN